MKDLKKRLRERHDTSHGGIFFVEDLKLAAVVRIEELEQALKEAVEWNWLDEQGPPPRDCVRTCEKALSKC